MRIRTQLVLLVLAVIAPVALLAALATVGLWELQRDAYRDRLVERVSALRIALDTELESTLRQLSALSDAIGGDGDEVGAFVGASRRLLQHFPTWSAIGLLHRDGSL